MENNYQPKKEEYKQRVSQNEANCQYAHEPFSIEKKGLESRIIYDESGFSSGLGIESK